MTTNEPFGGDNVVAVIYGPSGHGKTSDLLYSFPRGLFIAPPGALKPAYGLVGHVPESIEAKTVMEATKILKANSASRKFDAVVVDDFSLLAEATVSELEKKLSGFKLWGALRDVVLEFRDTARHAGLHVALSAHESTPKTSSGIFVRGGPRLPGKLPEDLPTACDIVLRTRYDGTRQRGWHIAYSCNIDDPQWVTKDRHNVTPVLAPMNLAEILRCAGYTIQRAPGLEWQEGIVAALAQALLETPNEERELMAEAIALCREQTENALHTRWVMRDALDRAALTRAQADAYRLYL